MANNPGATLTLIKLSTATLPLTSVESPPLGFADDPKPVSLLQEAFLQVLCYESEDHFVLVIVAGVGRWAAVEHQALNGSLFPFAGSSISRVFRDPSVMSRSKESYFTQ